MIKKVKSKRLPKGYGYRIDLRLDGIKRIRKTFPTYEEARDAENALVSRHLNDELGLTPRSSVRLEKLVGKHLDRIQNRLHYGAIKTILHRFRDLVGPGRRIEQLTPTDMENYLTERLRKIKPQTVNREMTEIKSMLNSAWRYFPELKNYRAPRVTKLQEPQTERPHQWEEEEVKKVLAELLRPRQLRENPMQIRQRHQVAELFIVCLETGMRGGEARTLTRKNLNFTKREITITSYKGNRTRTRKVPMNDTVYEILKRRAEESDIIFPSITDPTKPMSTYHKAFAAACDRAGVSYGRTNGDLVFYDTRQTFENEALDRGESPKAIGDILGHSAATMAKHYARAKEAQRRAVVNTGRNYGRILSNDPRITSSNEQ